MMKAAQGPGQGSGMPLGSGGPNPGQHSPNQNMHSGEYLKQYFIYYFSLRL